MKLPAFLLVEDDKVRIDPARFDYSWHVFVPWLQSKGISEDKSRRIVGKIAKYLPKEALLPFLVMIAKCDPAEPVAYIHKMLSPYLDVDGTKKSLGDQVAAAAREARYRPPWQQLGYASQEAMEEEQRQRALRELAAMQAGTYKGAGLH